VLRVDEQGTVAAAVTEVELFLTGLPSAPVHTLAFNRPYLFAISSR
jgi:serine protease inhibitor